MASFNDCLTVDGQRIFALMAKGNKVTFTKVVLGDGIKDNSVSEVDIRSVINPVVELNIGSVTMSEDNKVTISTIFQNTQSAPFFMREKGVYATVDGTEEYLVFYANNGTLAEYVDVAKTQLIEKNIQTVIMFSESDNINITLSSNEVVEMVSDLEKRLTAHVENESNPHKVDAEQVGLGNVPNVSTNNQTPTYTVASANAALSSGEKLSVAMGKIAKAISSLISHLSNESNPHKVTAEQIGAIDTLISMEEVNASTDLEKPVGAGAVQELSDSLGDITAVGGATYNTVEKILQYYIDMGYLPALNTNALIPIMTSNTSDVCTLSASDSSIEPPYKAFDGNPDTVWSSKGGGIPGWLQVAFTEPKIVKKYYVNIAGSYAPETIQLQASNNGSTWDNLSTAKAITGEYTEQVANNTAYKYYRFYLTEGHGQSQYAVIPEAQLYSK